MTIEEALLELGLFQTPQPPPDLKMYVNLDMLPFACDHGVPTLHTCIKCKAEAA